MDEKNAIMDIAILQLEEDLRRAFLEDGDWDSERKIDCKRTVSNRLDLMIVP
jgi:hypothetical protein